MQARRGFLRFSRGRQLVASLSSQTASDSFGLDMVPQNDGPLHWRHFRDHDAQTRAWIAHVHNRAVKICTCGKQESVACLSLPSAAFRRTLRPHYCPLEIASTDVGVFLWVTCRHPA